MYAKPPSTIFNNRAQNCWLKTRALSCCTFIYFIASCYDQTPNTKDIEKNYYQSLVTSFRENSESSLPDLSFSSLSLSLSLSLSIYEYIICHELLYISSPRQESNHQTARTGVMSNDLIRNDTRHERNIYIFMIDVYFIYFIHLFVSWLVHLFIIVILLLLLISVELDIDIVWYKYEHY